MDAFRFAFPEMEVSFKSLLHPLSSRMFYYTALTRTDSSNRAGLSYLFCFCRFMLTRNFYKQVRRRRNSQDVNSPIR